MKVINYVGHGVYEKCVAGEYAPDLIVYDKIILQTKTVNKVLDIFAGQVINYLKVTGYKTPGLNGKKVILSWSKPCHMYVALICVSYVLKILLNF